MFSPTFHSTTLCYSWFLRSPEPCSCCSFPLFHLIAYIFFPFVCLPVCFIFFSSPEAKVILFFFLLFFSSLCCHLPFLSHSILFFLPIHFPITPLFAASGKWAVSLLCHYSLFLLVARETNRQCSRCQFCIQLPVQGRECAVNRDCHL